MRTILLLILLLPVSGWAWTGYVVGVPDGDTLTIMDPERGRVTVRLYGIDSPEIAQPGGARARGILSMMALRKAVDGQTIDVDRYGRDVAIVRVQGACLSTALVRAGWAWVYPRYCRQPACVAWADLQSKAEQRRIGLWADDHPVEPWLWRRGQRSR